MEEKMARVKAVGDLSGAEYNPRTMGERARQSLINSLSKFGDISGITYNVRTGNLVSGHQRVEALKVKYGDALTVKKDEIVAPDGNVFPIRLVDWDVGVEKAANVAANSRTLQGRFDDSIVDLLAEIEEGMPEVMIDLGLDNLLVEEFSAEDLERLIGAVDKGMDNDERLDEWVGMPEFKQDDKTSKNAVIVHFRSDEDKMLFAKLVEQENMTAKTKSIWWPVMEHEDLLSKVCVDEDSE
jgi:hypothetical protein